ncbi:MAG: type IV pilin protein [Pseudomonadota bacterium]
MKQYNQGLSLVELIVVVAIVGILSALGAAWYQNFIREANRTSAQNALLELANAQEKRFISNNGYFTANTDIPNLVATTSVAGTGMIYEKTAGNFFTTDDHYRITLAGTANTFTFTAIASSAAQTPDTACASITINQANQRAPQGCW